MRSFQSPFVSTIPYFCSAQQKCHHQAGRHKPRKHAHLLSPKLVVQPHPTQAPTNTHRIFFYATFENSLLPAVRLECIQEDPVISFQEAHTRTKNTKSTVCEAQPLSAQTNTRPPTPRLSYTNHSSVTRWRPTAVTSPTWPRS